MAKAEFVLSAKRNIYKRGRKVQYVSKRGKKAGQTLTKIDRFQPASYAQAKVTTHGASMAVSLFIARPSHVHPNSPKTHSNQNFILSKNR